MLEAEPGAVAFQISDVPRRALARRTSDQVSPPPDTVRVCPFDGPSAAAKASSTSPVWVAPSGPAVTVSRPSALAGASMPSSPGTGGGVVLVTLRATGVVVLVLPWESVVRAATQWTPSTTVVESQLSVYGLLVATPTVLPSTRYCTPPTLAVVLADRATSPATRAPSAGPPHVMVGGVVSGWRTSPAVTVPPAIVTLTSVSLLASLASAR